MDKTSKKLGEVLADKNEGDITIVHGVLSMAVFNGKTPIFGAFPTYDATLEELALSEIPSEFRRDKFVLTCDQLQ